MTNEIKEIIRLNCDEEIEVKYFAKNDSLVDTTMDYSQLLDYITNLQEDYCDLKTRIHKAIKYIKWNLDKNDELIEYFNYDGNFNELLKILKGEE